VTKSLSLKPTTMDNLADKARRFGIPVWKFGNGGA
jgi:hypothetical protein